MGRRRGENGQESAEAAEAFAAYVALGPGRSLRALAESYVSRGIHKSSSGSLRTLGSWSAKFGWQERLRQAATERAERLLEEAAEIDAGTFLGTSRELARLVGAGGMEPEQVVKVRESVRRKPVPGAAVQVNVSVDVELRQLAERAAEASGLDPQQVIAEAERIFADMRGADR